MVKCGARRLQRATFGRDAKTERDAIQVAFGKKRRKRRTEQNAARRAKEGGLFEVEFEIVVFFLDFDFFNVGTGHAVLAHHFGELFRNRVGFGVAVPIDFDLARPGFDAFLRGGVNDFELAAFLDIAETRAAAVGRFEFDAEPGRDRFPLVGRDAGNRNEFVRGFRAATANGDDGGGREGR